MADGIIGGISGIFGARSKKKALKKAAKAQKQALAEMRKRFKELDPQKLNVLAQNADRDRAIRRLKLQEEIDPELAELRKVSKQQMLEQAKVRPEDRESGKLARTLYEEVKAPDERTERIKDQLLAAAQQELAAGATLPPEFQAELVRSGLSTGSQAGLAIDKNVIGGGVARALGSAGVQLQQQRQQQAMAMTQQAENLKNSRVNILASVFPRLRDLEAASIAETRQNFGISEAALPESGLGGSDMVNLKMGQVTGNMKLDEQRGNMLSQQAMARGQANAEMIGAIGQTIGGALNLGTGGLGGLVSQGVSALGGLFSSPGTISGKGMSPGAMQSNMDTGTAMYGGWDTGLKWK